MNTDSKFYQSIAYLALATGVLLLIPLVAMQLSNDVVWTLSDFIVAGTLLFGTGFIYLLVTRILAPQKGDNTIYRIAVGFALFAGLFLIWVNLAVGIIGSDDNPANTMYFGVIAVGLIGSFIARFRSEGMTYVMFAMAIAQALITAYVLIGGTYLLSADHLYKSLGVNGFFITLFIVSALLFRYAAQDLSPASEEAES